MELDKFPDEKVQSRVLYIWSKYDKVLSYYYGPQVIQEYLSNSSRHELPTDLSTKIQWDAPDISKFQVCSQ